MMWTKLGKETIMCCFSKQQSLFWGIFNGQVKVNRFKRLVSFWQWTAVIRWIWLMWIIQSICWSCLRFERVKFHISLEWKLWLILANGIKCSILRILKCAEHITSILQTIVSEILLTKWTKIQQRMHSLDCMNWIWNAKSLKMVSISDKFTLKPHGIN